jgi:hypothetical protein
MERSRSLMNGADELERVLLKGHLLLEEELFRLIGTTVTRAQPLTEARLTFRQKLCIAKALYTVDGWGGVYIRERAEQAAQCVGARRRHRSS